MMTLAAFSETVGAALGRRWTVNVSSEFGREYHRVRGVTLVGRRKIAVIVPISRRLMEHEAGVLFAISELQEQKRRFAMRENIRYRRRTPRMAGK